MKTNPQWSVSDDQIRKNAVHSPRTIKAYYTLSEDLDIFLTDVERAAIYSALWESAQCVASAARLLGINRTTLVMRMRALHINKTLPNPLLTYARMVKE